MHKKPIDKNRKKSPRGPGSGNRIAKNPAKDLLKDDDVRRWYENRYRSSVNNAGVMLRKLNLFCDRIGSTPKKYAELGTSDPRKAENILLDHVSWLAGQNYSPSYMVGVVKAAKSWLEYNRVEIKVKIRIKNADVPVTLENEINPEPGHIRQILAASPPRSRVVVSLMAFSGVRPQVMGLADGSDGLKLGDLPELNIDGKKVSFAKIPAAIVVRPNLSKVSSKYITFLSKTGCECVLGYLRSRIAEGEELDSESPLVRPASGWEKKGWNHHNDTPKRFLRTNGVTNAVSGLIKSVIKIRTYALRSYFDSQLLIAEGNACMTHAYRQFFMGHKGDMEARYTTNKGRLTEQMLEDMRRCYKNSQYFLYPEDADSKADKSEMLRDLWRQQAASQGLDFSNMMSPSSGNKPDGQTKPRDSDAARPEPEKNGAGSCLPRSKVISGDDELVRYLDMGWALTRELANNRYIIQTDAGAGE